MTAPNHALTGALIGLSIAHPVVAMPLAFISHFICDAIPHYDSSETDTAKRIVSKRFLFEYIIIGFSLCVILVLFLAYTRPTHWFIAAICAFLATSPDLFWIPRFVRIKRTGYDTPLSNRFLKFHEVIQWRTGPRLIWLELIWFLVCGCLLWQYL